MHLKGNLAVINNEKQKERKKCRDKLEAIILKSKDTIYLLKYNSLNLQWLWLTPELTLSHFISTGIKISNYQDLRFSCGLI